MTEFLNYEAAPRQLGDDQKEWFNKLEEELGVSIEVKWVAGRQDHVPVEEGKLMIYDMATSSTDTRVRSGDYVYKADGGSIVLTNRHRFRVANEVPVPIQLYTEGNASTATYAYGEVGHRQLLFAVPLSNLRKTPGYSHETVETMDDFIKPFIEKAFDDEYWDTLEERQRVEVVDKFMKYVTKLTEGQVQKEKEVVTQNEMRLASLEEQMLAVTKTLNQYQDRLEHAKKIKNRDEKFFKKQITELMEHKDFEKITYDSSSNALDIVTGPLYLYSPNKKERTLVGSFLIKYYLEGGTIRITNLTNKKGGRHHPHIPEDGNPCWGAMHQPINKLASRGELVPLMELLIGYLEKFSPTDDWGTWADNWWATQDIEYKCDDGEYRTKKLIKAIEKGEIEQAADDSAEIVAESDVTGETETSDTSVNA